MILVHGEEWRALRRRFNKGFAPQHLHSLAPLILEKTQIFVERLKTAAKNGAVFELQEYAQDLTTDIITMVCMERNFGAQTTPDGQGEKYRFGILTCSRALSAQAFKVGQGFNFAQYFDPIRPVLSWLNETTLDWRLYNFIQKQITQDNPPNSNSSASSSSKSARSIINLATDSLDPTPALIRNTVSQIKSFLFAGQDTTATLIQWLLYELSMCTNIQPFDPLYDHYRFLHKALVDEHDSVFGKGDPFSALTLLASKDDTALTSQLPITNAWVKETLRLHPPASTARWAKPPPISEDNPPIEIPITNPSDGSTTTATINGLRVYICHWLIQRNPSIWATPNLASGEFDKYSPYLFNPHRFLDAQYMSRIPVGAFRPFERGPRNCVGQSLATFEAVVVVCAVARGLVFEKAGGGSGLVLREGEEREKEVLTTHRVTAVVGDGMRMRVKMR
jgi:cytochrome P450